MPRTRQSIHLVIGVVDYESETVLRAYTTAAAAEAFAKRCSDYQARQPEVTQGPNHDAEWARYERWRDRHPAGSWIYDSFHTITRPIWS